MKIDEYLEKMKLIQKHIQTFIESSEDDEENFKVLNQIFEEQKIFNDRHEFKSVLYLISKIANNHFPSPNFFNKIEQILTKVQDEIKKNFSNTEIFHIFQKNKRILLFLIKSKMMIIDKSIYSIMKAERNQKFKYLEFFYPEVKTFCEETFIENFSKTIPDNFEEKREQGENDSYICSLIRKDLIEEFVSYVNRTNLSISGQIPTSIFETNHFLIKKPETTLIEYAAFFGSIQVFQYLRLNKIELMPSLWLYSIHGRNGELIHLLEENHVNASEYDNDFKKCLRESIKCFHSELTNYFRNHYIQEKDEIKFDSFSNIFDFYNFDQIEKTMIDQYSFYFLCKNDYFVLVDFLLNSGKIDVNSLIDCKDNILYCVFLKNTVSNIIFIDDIPNIF